MQVYIDRSSESLKALIYALLASAQATALPVTLSATQLLLVLLDPLEAFIIISKGC